jgi:hypothetical protein
MPIVRGPRPTDHYASIANEILQDERLSYRARGIAASILSRPVDWETSVERLASQGKEGEEAIRVALRELETHGYTFMHRTQGKRGRWRNTRYLFDRIRDAVDFRAQLDSERLI